MSPIRLVERTAEGIKGSDIGNLLVNSGRLSVPDLKRILALQAKEEILFGDAAVSLGILTDEDVRWALACQYSYPSVNMDDLGLNRELIVLHEAYDPRVESFRSIRSGLVFSGAGKIIRTVAILSPFEGEGRTFICANLAIVFAQLGLKTLLVDLNFRGPRIHSLFQIKNKTGASSVIIKRALVDNAITKTVIPSLSVLPSGPKPPNPLELLSWHETAELIGALRDEYDMVIVDTPAFSKTADGMMIASRCDGVILAALKGKTTISAFGNIKKQLESSGARILGSIINEIKEGK
jgi:chain length determinant protein tyrosine kinase EpsG